MSRKIEPEPFLAEVAMILAEVQTPAGGPAYTSADIGRILDSVFRAHDTDGALRALDRGKYDRARARLRAEREASTPRILAVVGELPHERRRRERAAAEHAARVAVEVEADPVEGTAAMPHDLTSDAAIERHNRAERARPARPVRKQVAERVARADAAPRAFVVNDLTTAAGQARAERRAA